MNPADAKKTKLNTDYPLDKIAGYATGSVTVPAFSPLFPVIPHGLAYTPLYIVKWSDDPNFSVSYDEIGVSFNFVTLNAQTDATNLNLFINNLTASSKTLYYRVLYFMPSNVNVTAAETQSNLDRFVLNTDYNYTKIFQQAFVGSSGFTVNHSLGYYPQVEAWYIRASDGKCVHVVDADVTNTINTPRVRVTTTDVIFENGSFTSASGWHYKIYIDEV